MYFGVYFLSYRQYIDLFYGGIFITDLGGSQKIYVGENKFTIEVDVECFNLEGFKKAIKEVMGYRNMEKMHFRMPGGPLACGLRLLYEMSIDNMLKIVTENN